MLNPTLRRLSSFCLASVLMAAPEVTDTAPLGTFTPVERRHWAFQPRKDVTPPVFTDAAAKAWIRTPIDAFVLAGLRKAELTPAAEADRATLIRRVTYNLHGLPPTPEEVAAFVGDKVPQAYERSEERRVGKGWRC